MPTKEHRGMEYLPEPIRLGEGAQTRGHAMGYAERFDGKTILPETQSETCRCSNKGIPTWFADCPIADHALKARKSLRHMREVHGTACIVADCLDVRGYHDYEAAWPGHCKAHALVAQGRLEAMHTHEREDGWGGRVRIRVNEPKGKPLTRAEVEQRITGGFHAIGALRPEKAVTFVYENWKGEREHRTIIPMPEGLFFGSNQWHPKSQWLLQAHDVERNALRDFAIAGMRTAMRPLDK